MSTSKDGDDESMESIMADIAGFDTSIRKSEAEKNIADVELSVESDKPSVGSDKPSVESDKPNIDEFGFSVNSDISAGSSSVKPAPKEVSRNNEKSVKNPLEKSECKAGTSGIQTPKDGSLTPVVLLTRLTPEMIAAGQKGQAKGCSKKKIKIFNEGDSISDASVSDSETSEFLKGNDILSFLTGSASDKKKSSAQNSPKVVPVKKTNKQQSAKRSKSSENENKSSAEFKSSKKSTPGKSTELKDSTSVKNIKQTAAAPCQKRKQTNSKDTSNEGQQEPEHQEAKKQHLKPGLHSHLLVRYLTKNAVKYYVGIVMDVTDGIFDVKFMKRTFDGTFVYPKNNDYDSITESNISMVVPEPMVTRRETYFFKGVQFPENTF